MKTLVAVNISVILSHHLPEQKHFIIFMPVPYLFFRYGWTMKMIVPELHDVEPAAVHIKMDVALFEIRRTGFPNLDFRVHGFHGLPRCLTDALLRAVFERPLVVEDELLAVVGLQGHESDIGLLVFHFILDMLLYID